MMAPAISQSQTRKQSLGGLPLPLRALVDHVGVNQRADCLSNYLDPGALARLQDLASNKSASSAQGRRCPKPSPACRLPSSGEPGASAGALSPQGSEASSASSPAHSNSTAEDIAEPLGESSAQMPARCRDVIGRVWCLSRDQNGCREVQAAFDEAGSDRIRLRLALELSGHVRKAMRCPHANHVLQKIIETCEHESLDFLVQELTSRPGLVERATRHRYGCRVMQQLIRKCPPEQVRVITEAVIADATTFACHNFACFVVQRLLECGTSDQRAQLLGSFTRDASFICRSVPGCATLCTALARPGSSADRMETLRLACAVLQESTVFPSILQLRNGGLAVALALSALQAHGCPEEEVTSARRALGMALETQRAARVVSAGSQAQVDQTHVDSAA